jgi:hypothetical protein
MGSHLRSSRMAPCLSSGRLPSPANASELRDVEFSVGGVSGPAQGWRPRTVSQGRHCCSDLAASANLGLYPNLGRLKKPRPPCGSVDDCSDPQGTEHPSERATPPWRGERLSGPIGLRCSPPIASRAWRGLSRDWSSTTWRCARSCRHGVRPYTSLWLPDNCFLR